MLANSLANPYVIDPTGNNGPEGVPVLCILGKNRIWGNCTGEVHFSVFAIIDSPLVFDVPKCLG